MIKEFKSYFTKKYLLLFFLIFNSSISLCQINKDGAGGINLSGGIIIAVGSASYKFNIGPLMELGISIPIKNNFGFILNVDYFAMKTREDYYTNPSTLYKTGEISCGFRYYIINQKIKMFGEFEYGFIFSVDTKQKNENVGMGDEFNFCIGTLIPINKKIEIVGKGKYHGIFGNNYKYFAMTTGVNLVL